MRALIFMTIGLFIPFLQEDYSVSDEKEIELDQYDLFQIDEPLNIEQELVNLLKEENEHSVKEVNVKHGHQKIVQERESEITNMYASISSSSSSRMNSSASISSLTETVENDDAEKEDTHEKLDLLARLVHSEARGEPYEGKIAVAEVVLNRMESNEFPDSMRAVIYQDGQFQVVSNGSIYNSPSETSVEAARQALDGTDHARGALFFYNYQIATNRWLDTLPTITVIGQHTFK